MDTGVLKRVISEQRDEMRKKFEEENIIEREIQKAVDFKKTKQVLVVSGVRRCGKSVLSNLFLKTFKHAYINFDDERLEPLKTRELNDVVEAFYQLYGDVNFMLFDKIQNVPKWELFITRLQRSKRVIVTGSNSKLLSGELATRLTGRHVDVALFPFSFREFLEFRGVKYDIYLTSDIAKLKNLLKEYLVCGGFPEGDDKKHLRSIYNDIITKDILFRYNIRFRPAFREFARLVVSSFSNEVTYSRLRTAIGVKSVHTVKNYFDMLEEAFLVFRLPKFSFKFSEQLREPKKVYVVDSGIINMLGFKFMEGIGRLYENTVFMELKRRQCFNPNQELFYYKGIQGYEVDFVVKNGAKVERLIQVCYNIEAESVRKRELRALLHASKELKCKNLLIVTGECESEEEVSWFGIKRKVRFVPLWNWLLAKQDCHQLP